MHADEFVTNRDTNVHGLLLKHRLELNDNKTKHSFGVAYGLKNIFGRYCLQLSQLGTDTSITVIILK